jgi:hypothetical protein
MKKIVSLLGFALYINTIVTANDPPTLTTVNTLTGATEDAQFSILYATLATAANEADVDGDPLSFRVEAVTTGTLTKGGLAVVPGTTLIASGDTWVWTPAVDANGILNAFTIIAWDGTNASSTAIQVQVNVTAVNDPPVLTAVSTLTGTTEDTQLSISYATLAAAANEADVDGDPLSFRVEAVSTGTLTKGGVAVVPGTTLIASGETWVWTPAVNANGILNAFTIRAKDGTLFSAAVQVQVNVTAVNDPPMLTAVSTLTGATEDTQLSISYATLAAAADEADVDGDPLSFRVEAVSTGTLTKGGVAVVPGTTLIASGETWVWTPAVNANGILNAFTIRAKDGTHFSAAVQVQVNVTAVNDSPVLTTVSTLTGATEDTQLSISYATLAAAADEADVDGDPLSFRVQAVSIGTLTKGGLAVVPGTTLIASGDTWVWTPAVDANGMLNAFTIIAWDGTNASSTAIQVQVNVTAVNDPPVLTTVSTLMGATEDTQLSISYATLAAAADEADVDGDPLSFRVQAVSTGTLTKGGVPVVPGTTLIASDDTWEWTPAVDSNGILNAFTIMAWDGTNASSTAIQVQVNATAVNDVPVVNAGPNGSITEGSVFGQAGSFSDPDAGDIFTAQVTYGDAGSTKSLTIDPVTKTFDLNNVYTDNGVYTITIRVRDDNGGMGTDQVTVTVNNVTPAVSAGPDGSGCEGYTFSQAGSFSDPGADTFEAKANYGDGSPVQTLTANQVSKTFDLNHVYPDNGVYTITITVTDDDGAAASDMVQVTVNPEYVFNENHSICHGETYNWHGVEYSSAGIYYDNLLTTNGCDSVYVLNLSVITIDNSLTVSDTHIMANASGAIYQWLDCNNGFAPISGEVNQSYEAVSGGNYAVIITQGLCTDTSACVQITANGINSNQIEGIAIYPNPVLLELTIEIKGSKEKINFEILNATGQVVSGGSFVQQTTVQTSTFAPGIYLIKLENGKTFDVKKIIKE